MGDVVATGSAGGAAWLLGVAVAVAVGPVVGGADAAHVFRTSVSGTLVARDPNTGVRAELDARGATLRREGEPWSVVLRATQWRCGPSAPWSPVERSEASRSETRPERFEYRGIVEGDFMTEWFEHADRGVEQGWTLDHDPCGRLTEQALEIEVRVTGLSPRGRPDGGIDLLDGAGLARLHYTELRAVDRDGAILPSAMTAENGAVVVRAELGGARFPVVVDPLAWVQVEEISAADGLPSGEYGHSVALAGDTAVVGAPFATLGRAYVLTRSGDRWTPQQTLDSPGPGGDRFGYSVSVSGSTLVVGAPYTKLQEGAAYVYALSGKTWVLQQKLTPTGATSGNRVGFAVVLSGGTVVLGAPNSYAGTGAAYVFTESGGVWTQSQTLSSGGTIFDGFGTAVAMDANLLVVGAPSQTVKRPEVGAAYVFAQSGGAWSLQQELAASKPKELDEFGSSVAVSGATVVVGASSRQVGATANQGAAFVFHQTGTTWAQTQELSASDGAGNDYFGATTALSGGALVVGAPYKNDFAGQAYLFVQSGSGAWVERGHLPAADLASSDDVATSVAVSGDTAFVGAPGTTVGVHAAQGVVYVERYALTNGSPCRSPTVCASGYCVDGVCCNDACDGTCLACAASLQEAKAEDGTCGPARAGTNPHKSGCSSEPASSCGTDGECDGKGKCELYASGVACGACSGSTLTTARCDGRGTCEASRSEACPADRVCAADGKTCETTCDKPSDCVQGFVCSAGACVQGAVCVGAHTSQGSGGVQDCAPYACASGLGVCNTKCASVNDCSRPNVCDPSGQCVPPPSPGSAAGACTVARGPATTGGAAEGLALAGLVLARRRRRRSTSRSFP